MLLTILLLVFGIIALAKGEFKITAKRKVKDSTARILGIALLLSAGAVLLPDYGGGLQFLLLIVIIVVGLATSVKIEPENTTPRPNE
jgi:uncharacterized membrane protein HdeD (DUF308 family)